MTYNPNIPRPKDIFANSQENMLINFSSLFNAFARNHIALDAGSGAGNHSVIELAEQPIKDQFQTDAGEISAYSKKVEGQTDQLFLRYQGNQDEFQYSNYQLYNPRIQNQVTFTSFLPGNLFIYFGQVGLTGFIDLQPYVAKEIIAINLCSAQGKSSSPEVSILTENKICKKIVFTNQQFFFNFLVVASL